MFVAYVEYSKRTESADIVERFSELKRLIFMHFCIILHVQDLFLTYSSFCARPAQKNSNFLCVFFIIIRINYFTHSIFYFYSVQLVHERAKLNIKSKYLF